MDTSSSPGVALILDLEARLRARGVSVSRVCRQAEKDRADWQRWKGGRVPRRSSWREMRAVLVEWLGEEGIPVEFPAAPALYQAAE